MYLLIFLFWFAIEMINHVPFWMALAIAAFYTVLAILLLTVFFWVVAALGYGTYGVVQLFKKLF